MNVLIVEPGRYPYAKEISSELSSMQEIVGGYIQAIYPFDDHVALVCEEEACLHHEQNWNRPLENFGIIKGTFFICGFMNENFTDLSPTLTQKYKQLFQQAYYFIKIGKHIIPVPLDF